MTTNRAAVIGAGPMGLGAAYELLKAGYEVTIYERDSRIGGMSASFDLDGLKIERYYHFICATDHQLFEYLREFALSDKLIWRETSMGFYYDGRLYKWGTPLALLSFPRLGLISKLRYALHVYYTKGISDWNGLDKVGVTEWLHKWIGKRAYDVLWRSLFELKFYEYKDALSAAWLGTRIKRVALSRKNIFVERLGYLEGGSDTFLDEIERRIAALGGAIRLSAGVDEIVISEGKVRGLRLGSEVIPYDCVVSTIPLPYLVRIVPGLPEPERAKVAAIRNIGVVCVTLKLKRPFTANFWTNINDRCIQIPGLIEYTNLNPLSQTVVYAPFYMPQTHPKYRQDKNLFIEEVLACMERINPGFSRESVLAANAFRYEFAQTVCTPNFYEALPPMRSAACGLFMADTSHYYPEDRSMSESLRVGKHLAELVQQSTS
jgi:protoporphyrinogen oxidase